MKTESLGNALRPFLDTLHGGFERADSIAAFRDLAHDLAALSPVRGNRAERRAAGYVRGNVPVGSVIQRKEID